MKKQTYTHREREISKSKEKLPARLFIWTTWIMIHDTIVSLFRSKNVCNSSKRKKNSLKWKKNEFFFAEKKPIIMCLKHLDAYGKKMMKKKKIPWMKNTWKIFQIIFWIIVFRFEQLLMMMIIIINNDDHHHHF